MSADGLRIADAAGTVGGMLSGAREQRELLAVIAIVVAGLAAAARPATVASPIGDGVGIAFFATMHRAYIHTPGVEMTVVSRGVVSSDTP